MPQCHYAMYAIPMNVFSDTQYGYYMHMFDKAIDGWLICPCYVIYMPLIRRMFSNRKHHRLSTNPTYHEYYLRISNSNCTQSLKSQVLYYGPNL